MSTYVSLYSLHTHTSVRPNGERSAMFITKLAKTAGRPHFRFCGREHRIQHVALARLIALFDSRIMGCHEPAKTSEHPSLMYRTCCDGCWEHQFCMQRTDSSFASQCGLIELSLKKFRPLKSPFNCSTNVGGSHVQDTFALNATVPTLAVIKHTSPHNDCCFNDSTNHGFLRNIAVKM